MPYSTLYYCTPSSTQGGEIRDTPSFVGRVTMRGFSGLEDSEETALHAMMEFTYHSTIGNMDEAFRAIKLIKR